MKIYIQTLSNKTLDLHVDPNDTVEALKLMIQEKGFLPTAYPNPEVSERRRQQDECERYRCGSKCYCCCFGDDIDCIKCGEFGHEESECNEPLPERQRLIFAGLELEEGGRCLRDYNINTEDMTVHLVLRVEKNK